MRLRHVPLAALIAGSALTLGGPLSTRAGAQAATTGESRDSSLAELMRDIRYLASEQLAGRASGSPGSDSAATYLARTYFNLQLEAGIKTDRCDASGACFWTYFQLFNPPADLLRQVGMSPSLLARNVVAVVAGTDSALAGQWLILGAHYDHLGSTGVGSLDHRFPRRPHLGADDNASGTAALLELARRLAIAPLRRPVMLVHFGAEEIGLIGSGTFVADPPVPIDSVVAMLNFDMVGHLKKRKLELSGIGTSKEWRALLDSANSEVRLPLNAQSLPGGGSDHVPFYLSDVPVLHFFTGLHPAYHTTDDTVDRIDFEGLLRVIDLAERVIRLVGDRDRPLATFRKR